MKTELTETDIENFWIRVYLHSSSDLFDAAINRAYRDFNRTQHGIREIQTIECYSGLKKVISRIANEAISKDFSSQQDFDDWHKEKCQEIIAAYLNILEYSITVGQAQKWINMTLKYLFALGEKRIPGILKNYKYFHIPIDNIIQDKLALIGIKRLKAKWSRINSYDDYLNYQTKVREEFAGKIPMDIEFRLFNE